MRMIQIKISWIIPLFLVTLSCYSQENEILRIDSVDNIETESFEKQKSERMPRFPGCEDINGTDYDKYICAERKMLEYIYSELRYPEKAFKNGVEGTAVVSFIVSEHGKLQDITLVQNLRKGCGAEALRVVEKMSNLNERWVPGIQSGKRIPVRFNLPILFSKENSPKSRKQ
jgi:TonB family protein